MTSVRHAEPRSEESLVQRFYLVATIVGGVVPYLFFIDYFADEGVDLPAFIEALFANGAAGGFTADLLITSVVFWAFMFTRPQGPNPWPVVLVNMTVGLSCAFPLYLYLESRRAADAGRGTA